MFIPNMSDNESTEDTWEDFFGKSLAKICISEIFLFLLNIIIIVKLHTILLK